MILRAVAPLLFVACCLPAQQPVEPTQPHIVIETVGPDGWRARLGPTNLGVMLASEEGRSLWQPSMQPLLGMWAGLAGNEEAYKLSSERLLGYGGTIRIAAFINDGSAANLAIVFDGDRRTDMDAVGADIRKLIEGLLPGEWREREAAGHKLELRRSGPDFVTAPVVDGKRLTMMMGDRDSIEGAMGLAAWLAARPATLTIPKPGSPALRVTFDLQPLISLGGVGNEQALLTALGLDGLKQLTLTLGAAGPHVQFGAAVEIDGAPRGVVKAFMPARQAISGLAALLPENSSASKVGRFDLHAFFEGVIDAIDVDLGDEDARATVERELGMDPSADMLAHATDEMLVVGSPFQDFDRLSEATWMLAWRLADDKKFAAGLEKLMQGAKPLIQTAETVDVDGVKLRRYGNPVGYDLWMAAGNGVWVISAGRDAEEQARDLLRAAKGRDFKVAAAPAKHLEDLGRNLPPGLNGYSGADLGSIVGMPVDWWLELLPELLPRGMTPDVDEDTAEEQMEEMRALLKRHNLDRLRSATGFDAGTWRWRLYW